MKERKKSTTKKIENKKKADGKDYKLSQWNYF